MYWTSSSIIIQSIIWSKKIKRKVDKYPKTTDNVEIDRNDYRNAFAYKAFPPLKLQNSDLEAINFKVINCLPKEH